jgi:hypothetical protein
MPTALFQCGAQYQQLADLPVAGCGNAAQAGLSTFYQQTRKALARY